MTTMTRRTAGKIISGAALCVLSAPAIVRAQGSLQKITLSYPTQSGASWPMYVAKEAGYYEKNGLDVTLVFGVHPTGIAMLVSGQAQALNYGIDPLLIAATKDPLMVLMASTLNKASFALIVQPEIKSPQDLKGKRIGVSRIGDTPYHLTVSMMKKWGLTARDVQWVPAGAETAARFTAMLGGLTDATLVPQPYYYRMIEEAGKRMLANVADFQDIYVSTATVFRKSHIAQNKELPEKVIRAHAEAIKRIYEDRELANAVYAKYDKSARSVDIPKQHEFYLAKDVLDRVPFVVKPAIDAAIERDGDTSPQMKTFDYKQVIDNSVVLKLVREGYFAKLFGPGIKAEQDEKLKLAFGV